jgi:hypothetical protein
MLQSNTTTMLRIGDTEVARIGLSTNRLTNTSEHIAFLQEAVRAVWGAEIRFFMRRGCIRGSVRRAGLGAGRSLVAASWRVRALAVDRAVVA